MMDPRMAALARAVMGGENGTGQMFQPASEPLNIGPTPVLPIQRTNAGYGVPPALGGADLWKQLGAQRRPINPMTNPMMSGSTASGQGSYPTDQQDW